MKRLVIPDESFGAVMDEVSREVGKALEKPFEKREEREAFYIFTASLSTLASERFHYLPEEDRNDIVAFCGTWVDVGILMGKSPGILADILKKTSLRTVEVGKGE